MNRIDSIPNSMNRLDHLLSKKSHKLLSVYFTAGYPQQDSTIAILENLANRGVDMVEIGIPFSDPMADGPVIQASSSKALAGGMTLARLFDDVKEARKSIPDMPFIIMGYLNPIYQWGIERFFESCHEAGIDGMIIPDLPFDEYLKYYKPLCDNYHIPVIMLITPETSERRIRLIDDNCDGFIYMVSAASTTGTRDIFNGEQVEYFRRIDAMDLKHPRLVGFGISNPTTRRQALDYSRGVIVGSLFIKCLDATHGNIPAAVDLLLATLE